MQETTIMTAPRKLFSGKAITTKAATFSFTITLVQKKNSLGIIINPRSVPLWLSKRPQHFSARTTKRFLSSRCASAIQMVRPCASKADTQPQLQPAFLRLSAIISQYFTPGGFTAAFPRRVFEKQDRSATDPIADGALEAPA